MTFGELDKALPDSQEHGEETSWTPFDWRSESYQLMCREYRMSLGIVHPSSYESNYQTASEYLYWENLYKVRGYGPYKRKQHVIPDPPDAWQREWAEKRDRNITDDTSSNTPTITKQQEARGKEHLERLEGVGVKDEKGEIIAFSDADVLSEFQVWLAKENLGVTEEMAQAIRDSWAHFFVKDRQALAAKAAIPSIPDSAPYQEYD